MGRWTLIGAVGLLAAYATAAAALQVYGSYSIISDGHNTAARLLANPISVRLPLLVPNSGEWWPKWAPGPLVFDGLPKVAVGIQMAFWLILAIATWTWVVVAVRAK